MAGSGTWQVMMRTSGSSGSTSRSTVVSVQCICNHCKVFLLEEYFSQSSTNIFTQIVLYKKLSGTNGNKWELYLIFLSELLEAKPRAVLLQSKGRHLGVIDI